jgi:hypothetical protein
MFHRCYPHLIPSYLKTEQIPQTVKLHLQKLFQTFKKHRIIKLTQKDLQGILINQRALHNIVFQCLLHPEKSKPYTIVCEPCSELDGPYSFFKENVRVRVMNHVEIIGEARLTVQETQGTQDTHKNSIQVRIDVPKLCDAWNYTSSTILTHSLKEWSGRKDGKKKRKHSTNKRENKEKPREKKEGEKRVKRTKKIKKITYGNP